MLEQARTINPGGDAGHTPSACGRMSKESTQSFGTARHRDTTPTPFSVVGQKRIHIFQGNIVERMILLAQPAQELLHMPALSADGDGRQAALVALVSSKVGKPVCKRYEPGWGRFQTSLLKLPQKPPGLRPVLESDHEIVGVADRDHVPPRHFLAPDLYPQIENIVQVHVRQGCLNVFGMAVNLTEAPFHRSLRFARLYAQLRELGWGRPPHGGSDRG